MSNVTVKMYRKEREAEIMGGLEKAMNKVGLLVENEAKKNATNPRGGSKHPWVISGEMSSNIGHTTKTGGSEIVSIIGFSSEIKEQSPVNYARRIELGSPRQPPYPFLFPAVESKKSEIIDILKKSGSKNISITEG
mgnify:CR=1 FL=1